MAFKNGKKKVIDKEQVTHHHLQRSEQDPRYPLSSLWNLQKANYEKKSVLPDHRPVSLLICVKSSKTLSDLHRAEKGNFMLGN